MNSALLNLLNQYAECEYPEALDARGVANAGFTVEVNGVVTTRTGANYYGVGTFNNSSAAVLGELEIEITDPGPPPVLQPPEVFSLNTTGRTDPYVIPETSEEFTYDLDGNIIAWMDTSDGFRPVFFPSPAIPLRNGVNGSVEISVGALGHPQGGIFRL